PAVGRQRVLELLLAHQVVAHELALLLDALAQGLDFRQALGDRHASSHRFLRYLSFELTTKFKFRSDSATALASAALRAGSRAKWSKWWGGPKYQEYQGL